MRHAVLDLFSGIGGFSLGLERAGMKTIAFCEIDKFCQKVLRKHWPDVPIYDDITKLDGRQFYGAIDIVCGGFPCQPFSVAGKQKGKNDNRHLWPEMLRIIQEVQPSWVIGENVPGIINMELEQVCFDLETKGYEVQPIVIPACAVNAPHKRSRVWIIAYSKHVGRNTITQQRGDGKAVFQGKKGAVSTGEFKGVDALTSFANAASTGLERKDWHQQALPQFAGFSGWEAMPRVCGGDNGISKRVDRIKALGNAVVPQIPELLGHAIIEVIKCQ